MTTAANNDDIIHNMQFWKPASDIAARPVAVIGAGVLGRRIG